MPTPKPQQDTSAITKGQSERGIASRPGLADRLRQSRERAAGGSNDPSRAVGSNDRQVGPRSGGAGSSGVRPQDSVASDPTRSGTAGRLQSPGRVDSIRSRGGIGPRADDRSLGAARPQTPGGMAAVPQAQRAQAEARHQGLSSRLNEHRERVGSQGLVSAPRQDSGTRLSVGVHADFGTRRPLYLHARYYDRPDLIRHTDRHIYTYYDPYNRLHHRVIWPTYYYPVCYSFGPYASCEYVWPYYHRKYVFISLGGWWPYDYTYMRYYWYSYHPYMWYGYYPVAREVVVGGGDNYYTYNYNYYGDDGGYANYSSDSPMDQSTQAELRARLERQKAAEPAPQTLADTRFEEGVKSFEAGEYAAAAVKFGEAMRQSPKDMILPFAYAQALFADGQYDKAADVLRGALKNVSPEKEGVFFPRGLYSDDDVLFGQVEKLVDKVDRANDDADLQLLLGYQLLGVGETGYARESLEQARQDPRNAGSAGILMKLLDKMEKEAGPANKAGGDTFKVPEAKADSSAIAPAAAAPAAQAGTTGGTESTGTPEAPAGIAPATSPQNKQNMQEEKPSDTGKKSEGAVDQSSLVPTQDDTEQPAGNNDGGAAVEVDQAGFLGGAATAGVLPSLGRLMGSHAPNYRMDIVIFGSILSLALIGVWIEWRLPSRRPV